MSGVSLTKQVPNDETEQVNKTHEKYRLVAKKDDSNRFKIVKIKNQKKMGIIIVKNGKAKIKKCKAKVSKKERKHLKVEAIKRVEAMKKLNSENEIE